MMVPKIYECVANDPIRPVMGHALITREDVAVTNAHVLVVHKTDELFEKEFIDSLPEDGILLDKEALKDLNKQDITMEEYDSEMKLLTVTHNPPRSGGEVKRVFTVKINGSDFGTFPNFKAVWPDGPIQSVERIKLNPIYLEQVRKGMGAEAGITMEFYGESRAIVCEAESDLYPSCKALIMPMVV